MFNRPCTSLTVAKYQLFPDQSVMVQIFQIGVYNHVHTSPVSGTDPRTGSLHTSQSLALLSCCQSSFTANSPRLLVFISPHLPGVPNLWHAF